MARLTVADPRFAAKLGELRRSRNLSLHGLAQRAYVSRSHISELERASKPRAVAPPRRWTRPSTPVGNWPGWSVRWTGRTPQPTR